MDETAIAQKIKSAALSALSNAHETAPLSSRGRIILWRKHEDRKSQSLDAAKQIKQQHPEQEVADQADLDKIKP